MDRYDEAMALLEGLQYTFEPREEVLIQMGNVAQICGHVEDSERYYRQALTLVPAFEDALFELAFLLESEDRTDEALVLYETYLDERPYAAMVWHNLGLLYRKLGNYEKALEAFDFALAIVPEMAPAWFNRGELLMDQGRIAEAVQAFIETHAISSHDPMTQYRIAECFEALEMYRDAIRFYRKAAISDPDYLDAYVGIGFCLEKLEQFTEAIHYYQKAHRIDSENAEISLAIATCEYRLGNHHSAYLFLEQAIVLEPQDVNIWQDWAMLLFEHDNVSGAISFLEEGIKANPREAVLYYQCAAYCYLNQAFDQGATYLENALLLDVEARHILFQIVPAIRLFPGVEDLIQHYRNLYAVLRLLLLSFFR
jgi:tetratricopeptide (TPR) repeat protein